MVVASVVLSELVLPKLLFVSSGSLETIDSMTTVFTSLWPSWTEFWRVGLGFFETVIVGIICEAICAMDVGIVFKVCLHRASGASLASFGTSRIEATASRLASTLPTLNMVFRVSLLDRGLRANRFVVMGNSPVRSRSLNSTSCGMLGIADFSDTCVVCTVKGLAVERRVPLISLCSLPGF